MSATSQNPQLREDLRDLFRRAYDHGFRAGEAVGRSDAAAEREKGIFIGLAFGIAFGCVIAVLVLPSLARWLG